MLRIMTYNIWVGGTDRINALAKMMRVKHPDIIAVIEATNLQVVIELAEKLDLSHHYISGYPKHEEDWQVAVLSRFPFVGMPVVHTSPPLTKPCLEVRIEEPDGNYLTVFAAHPTANFGNRTAGDNTRRREIHELLSIMHPRRGTPHLLMGDFSAIAPGDRLKGSILLRYVVNLQRDYQKNPEAFLEYPTLNYVVPPPFDLLSPFLRIVPQSKLLCDFFDIGTTIIRAPRGDLNILYKEGYIDCFRYKNPKAEGFTAPTIALAARFDYIFASPEMGHRLVSCSVVERAEDVEGVSASDHLPIFAEFQ